jgi:hypothetical protein
VTAMPRAMRARRVSRTAARLPAYALAAVLAWAAIELIASVRPAVAQRRGGARFAAPVGRAGPARSGSLRYADAAAYGRPTAAGYGAAAAVARPGAPRYRYRTAAAADSLTPGGGFNRGFDDLAPDDGRRYARARYLSQSAWASQPCARSNVSVGGHTYYRCGAGWYDRVYYAGDVNYAEIWPPEGYTVETLPAGYETLNSGATKYYVTDDAFYEQAADGYKVVDPPYGKALDRLPKGAENAIPIVAGGQTYYHYHGVYYREVEVADATHYEIAKSPFPS